MLDYLKQTYPSSNSILTRIIANTEHVSVPTLDVGVAPLYKSLFRPDMTLTGRNTTSYRYYWSPHFVIYFTGHGVLIIRDGLSSIISDSVFWISLQKYVVNLCPLPAPSVGRYYDQEQDCYERDHAWSRSGDNTKPCHARILCPAC